jgi:hypothetical protein
MISALIRSDTRELLLFLAFEDRSRRQARKRTLTKTQPCWYLDLRLPAPGLGESKFLVHKPPSAWYFVVTTGAKAIVKSMPAVPDLG